MINIEKSIRKQKLALENKFLGIAKYIFNFLIASICMGFAFFLPGRDLWMAVIADKVSITHIIFALVMWILGAWIVYGLSRINRLQRIEGLEIEQNKEIMLGVVQRYFSDLKFQFDNSLLIGQRVGTLNANAKRVIVVFKENDVFINIKTSLRFFGIESYLHVISNESDIKELSRRFRTAIKNAPQQQLFVIAGSVCFLIY